MSETETFEDYEVCTEQTKTGIKRLTTVNDRFFHGMRWGDSIFRWWGSEYTGVEDWSQWVPPTTYEDRRSKKYVRWVSNPNSGNVTNLLDKGWIVKVLEDNMCEKDIFPLKGPTIVLSRRKLTNCYPFLIDAPYLDAKYSQEEITEMYMCDDFMVAGERFDAFMAAVRKSDAITFPLKGIFIEGERVIHSDSTYVGYGRWLQIPMTKERVSSILGRGTQLGGGSDVPITFSENMEWVMSKSKEELEMAIKEGKAGIIRNKENESEKDAFDRVYDGNDKYWIPENFLGLRGNPNEEEDQMKKKSKTDLEKMTQAVVVRGQK